MLLLSDQAAPGDQAAQTDQAAPGDHQAQSHAPAKTGHPPSPASDRRQLEALLQELLPYRERIGDRTAYARPGTGTPYERSQLLLGMFDPNLRHTGHPAIVLEHLFCDLGNVQSGLLDSLLEAVSGRGHGCILTLEPWRDTSGLAGGEVLEQMLEGRFDSVLDHLFASLSGFEHPVWLRFAHEMEIPVDRYAWQNQDPLTYIRAFRYVMDYPRLWPQHVYRVWGPAGDRGSLEFWPGAEWVDYISIAIYGLPDKNIEDPAKQERFSTIWQRKSWRFRLVDKPFLLAEFGVKGPEDFQSVWLLEAAQVIRTTPQIAGICYFNREDVPEVWGRIETPDWSISENTFEQFLQALQSPAP